MKKITIQQLIKQDITKVTQSVIKAAIVDVVKQNKALKEEIRFLNKALKEEMRSLNKALKEEVSSTAIRLKKIEKALERANIELNPQPKEKKVVPPEKIRVSPELLKKLMKRLHLNQATLARLLGVTPQTISHWMMGRVQPSKALKAKIAILRGKTAAQISATIDTVVQETPPATNQTQEPAPQSE